MECFEALRRADIYAIGLLYWEVCRRTMVTSCGIAEEYKGMCCDDASINLFLSLTLRKRSHLQCHTTIVFHLIHHSRRCVRLFVEMASVRQYQTAGRRINC